MSRPRPQPQADSDVTDVATMKLYRIEFPSEVPLTMCVVASSPEKALEIAREVVSCFQIEGPELGAPELRELAHDLDTCGAPVYVGTLRLDFAAACVVAEVFPDAEQVTVAEAIAAGFDEGLTVQLSKPLSGQFSTPTRGEP